MLTVAIPEDASDANTFSKYFRSLKLLNFIQRYVPSRPLRPDRNIDLLEDEQQLTNRAAGTGLDPQQYRLLVLEYLKTGPTEQSTKFNRRDLESFLSTPAKPSPLTQFVRDHVMHLCEEIGKLPGGVEKARASVRGIVRSGLEGYCDEVYEAYSLLKDEIPQKEIQAVIAAWQSERVQFEKNLQYSAGLNPPKVFWPSSAIHFAQEGVARYRFKCDFQIGAFESAFLDFETLLSDSIASPIESDSIRSRAYDLCVISRSRDLVSKIRPSVESALSGLMAQQTGAYWSEWSNDERRLNPSVGTTSLAALALLKLGLSDWTRTKGREAATWLLEKQNGDGGWSLDVEREGELKLTPDIYTTISAMEAIARSGIPGASHHLDLSRQWIFAKQKEYGLWEDEAFRLPQPTVLVIETLDYLKNPRPRTIDTYLNAAIGYVKRALVLVEDQDATSRRLAVVTAHLGIESFLYSLIQTNNVTKFIDKGQTIGMRIALTSFQSWMQQKRYLKPNEILLYSNELARLAYLRDEIVHKALSVSHDDAASVVRPAAQFASLYSAELLGFDCLD